jgi:hypothetical protein
MDVFISHSSADTKLASRGKSLEKQGLEHRRRAKASESPRRRSEASQYPSNNDPAAFSIDSEGRLERMARLPEIERAIANLK